MDPALKLLLLSSLLWPAAGHAWQEDWSEIPVGRAIAQDDRTWNIPEARYYVVEANKTLEAKAAHWRSKDWSAAALYNRRLYAGDQSLSATVGLDPKAAAKGAVLYLCSSPLCPGVIPCEGYAFRFRPLDGGVIYRVVSGTTRPIGTAGRFTPKDWGKLSLNAARVGNLLSLSVDGHLVASAMDTAYGSGFAGFGVNRGGPDSAAIGTLSFQADRSEDAKPRLFHPNPSNPILKPEAPWEEDAVFEPNVIAVGKGFLMSYTGGWDRSAIGLARSADGVHWIRVSQAPVVGLGQGGEPGTAQRSNLMRLGSQYRLYYSDGQGNLRLADSLDGEHFQRRNQRVIPHDADRLAGSWASQGFIRDGTTWWALVDGQYPNGILWRLNLFKSVDNGLSFSHVAGPLDCLRVGFGSYGSPRPLLKLDGLYHVWYLVAWNALRAPTVLWHATSPDLLHWIPDPFRTLDIPGSEMGLIRPDQVADPDLIERGNKTIIYYDTVDNSHGAARIGMAVHNGDMKNLVQSYTDWTTP